MMKNVFYSWMSDLPNRTNRGLVADALKQAAKAISADPGNEFEVVVDQDTSGRSGSPDIANAIFEKIEQADVFVADVSIMNPTADSERRTPNPNVLIELGYAAHALRWSSIVMVFNAVSGDSRSDLPFDLGLKRAIIYKDEDSDHDRSEIRRDLAKRLERAILASLTSEESRTTGKWIADIAPSLFSLVIALDEFDERCGHWGTLADELLRWSDVFRSLAGEPVAEREGVRDDLNRLILDCEALSESLRRSGHEMDEPLTRLRAAAPVLRARLFDRRELSAESRSQVVEQIASTTRECVDLAARAEDLLNSTRAGEVKERAARIGDRMQRLLMYNVAFLGPAVEDARRAARAMHLIDNGFGEPLGGALDGERLEAVRTAAAAFSNLTVRAPGDAASSPRR